MDKEIEQEMRKKEVPPWKMAYYAKVAAKIVDQMIYKTGIPCGYSDCQFILSIADMLLKKGEASGD